MRTPADVVLPHYHITHVFVTVTYIHRDYCNLRRCRLRHSILIYLTDDDTLPRRRWEVGTCLGGFTCKRLGEYRLVSAGSLGSDGGVGDRDEDPYS